MMSKLIFLFIIALVLTFISCSSSNKALASGYTFYYRQSNFFWYLLSFILICFVGLRTHINDTDTYLLAYRQMEAAKLSLYDISLKIGDNPGFNISQWILIQLNFSPQSFLMFFSFLTNGIYLWFLRKYSQNLLFSIYLFLVFGGYIFTTAAIKQCVAVSFALLGIDCYINRKHFLFLFWIMLAITFHPYAFMFLLVPLLSFRPWTFRTYAFILLVGIIGFSLQPLLGTIIDITTLLGEGYTIEEFSGEGTNFFRFAVTAVPVLISFLTQNVILHRNDKTNNLLMNLTTMQALIMFIALFGTANYFARLANYFSIFMCLSLPWLITQFDKKSQPALISCSVICYFLFCYYENGILRPFDTYYASITLQEYLKTLF